MVKIIIPLSRPSGSLFHSKYLVGADGGRSLVRSLGKFTFRTTPSPFKWVRLDAVIKTNMPSPRIHSIAIESQKYGNVLWLPIDNERTRIGIVFPLFETSHL